MLGQRAEVARRSIFGVGVDVGVGVGSNDEHQSPPFCSGQATGGLC